MSYAALVVAGKLAIGLAGGVLGAWLAFSPWIHALPQRRFDRLLWASAAVSRSGLWFGLFWVLGYAAAGDVPNYLSQGRDVLAGGLVYRDFKSSYAPLFPYLLAGVLALRDSGGAVVAGACAIELASLALWLDVARRRLPERQVRAATVLYVSSPVALLNVAMQGQNNVWVSLLLAASLWLSQRPAVAGLAGCVYGFALAATKLLAAIFAPVLWLFSSGRTRWTAGFAAVVVAVYGSVFLLAGEAVLHPVLYESVRVTPGNLYFLTSASGVDLSAPGALAASSVLGALALVVAFLLSWRGGVHERPGAVFALLTVVLLVFLLSNKKSYPTYLVMAFFPLCVSVASAGLSRAWQGLWVVFGVVATLEMTLWFRWIDTRDLALLWSRSLPPGVERGHVLAFAIVDVILVSCYAALLVRAWRALSASAQTTGREAPRRSDRG